MIQIQLDFKDYHLVSMTQHFQLRIQTTIRLQPDILLLHLVTMELTTNHALSSNHWMVRKGWIGLGYVDIIPILIPLHWKWELTSNEGSFSKLVFPTIFKRVFANKSLATRLSTMKDNGRVSSLWWLLDYVVFELLKYFIISSCFDVSYWSSSSSR